MRLDPRNNEKPKKSENISKDKSSSNKGDLSVVFPCYAKKSPLIKFWSSLVEDGTIYFPEKTRSFFREDNIILFLHESSSKNGHPS